MPHFAQALSQVKIPAAWLIDQCGFKGAIRGAVGVHSQQALVLVNFGGGTGQQLLALADEISTAVAGRFAIALELEPRVYGPC
jgi:UDP-N-acetylmuramate dehydrogenase